jgi:hypothetical protein
MITSDVRELVQNTIRSFGRDAELIGERLLLKARHYAGRQFDFDGISAVWMFDADEIKFFDRSGSLLLAVRPGDKAEQVVRRAA